MDTVRKLILEKLAELGLTRKAVSRAMGVNETYLSQFLKRGAPAELGEVERRKLAPILKVSEFDLRGPDARGSDAILSDGIKKILIEPKSATDILTPTRSEALPRGQTGELFSANDLPVFSATVPVSSNGNGAFVVSANAVDWVERPARLSRVSDAYGLIVNDPAAPPTLPPGSTALIHPHLPPKAGDACIFRCKIAGEADRAFIREYRGETETHFKVRAHNPERDAVLRRADWTCHKVIGAYFA
jgi:hypothetical protein